MSNESLQSSRRAFVQHLLAEHRQLNRDLLAVSSALADAQASTDPRAREAAVQRLEGLRGLLRRHFAEESQGGCIDEAVSFAPQLASEARRLEQQHPQLLEQVDHLTSLARDERISCARLVDEFSRFSATLLAHEAAENRIVSRGFNMCGDLELEELEAEVEQAQSRQHLPPR